MHTTTNPNATLDEIQAAWVADKATRSIPAVAVAAGYDTVLVDSHLVDPTLARQRAIVADGAASPGGALLDAILAR